MVMVAAPVAGVIIADFRLLSLWRIAVLVLVSLVYILWNVHGTRNAVRWSSGCAFRRRDIFIRRCRRTRKSRRRLRAGTSVRRSAASI